MNLIRTKKVKNGSLTRGCKQCIKGLKSVLFITGKCHYTCFYCPISDDKRNQDIVKINEKQIIAPDSDVGLAAIIKEIRLCASKGIGITGGDPLAVIDRTVHYITTLKKEFGKRFHIHLYTSPQFVTPEKITRLEQAGLDELRFHFNVENETLWHVVYAAKKSTLLIGAEIPAIPGKLEETKRLMAFLKKTNIVKFINLNELEFSDISEETLTERGYRVKDSLSYGINKSESVALQLVDFGKSIRFATHYCSAGFKDGVQLANRFLRRSKNVALNTDIVDEEGMLLRGEITSKNIISLSMLKKKIQERFSLKEKEITSEHHRLLLSPNTLVQMWDTVSAKDSLRHEAKASLVKEYPTDDHFELERDEL